MYRFILFALLCMMMISAPLDARVQDAASSMPPSEQTSPVVVDGRTLFFVRGLSAYPADKRAQEIARHIVSVAANRAVSVDSLKLSESANATSILAQNQHVMAVVDADAVLEGVDRQVLAQVYVARIGEAINAYRHDRNPAFLSGQALRALIATISLLIGVVLGRLIVRRVHRILETRYRDRIRGVGIQSFQIIRTEQIWHALAILENLFTGVVLLTAVYLYLHYVLSLFPWTRGVAGALFSLLVAPVQTIGGGLLQMVPNIVFLVILALITRYVLVAIRLFFTAIENGTIRFREFDPTWAKPTYRLVRIAVIAFALVVAYPYIPGSSSQAFKGVSLFIGVLVSLGSTSLIGNVIAGYTLTYRRTFKHGDRVKIGEHLGDVEQSRVMATYLRTPKNELVVVPNSKIINEEVINYSTLARQDGLILHSKVGVGYDAPWRQVEAMLLEAAARTAGLLREPKPYVLQKALGDFSVTYEINGYTDQPQVMGRTYAQLHRNILDLFNEYGVQIMTPAYESDPDRAKVVPRDQWYAAPALPPDGEESRTTVSGDSADPSMPKAS